VHRALFPWQWVSVVGPSMVPTLKDGDGVLVRHTARIRPGDVVLATFRAMPDRLVLKRAVRPHEGGWWLASDNPAAGGDSAVHGVADVHARVLLRVRGRRVARVRARPTM
jgi:phage repressor protein C with HTH and peptisase S24 domain